MSVLAWEDPPPRPVGKGGRWGAVVGELHARPGEWARVEEHLTSRAAYALAGYLRRTYDLEVERRKTGPEWALWARWPLSKNLEDR